MNRRPLDSCRVCGNELEHIGPNGVRLGMCLECLNASRNGRNDHVESIRAAKRANKGKQ